MRCFILICALLVLVSCAEKSSNDAYMKGGSYEQWSDYLGGPDRNHFTTLDQWNSSNVGDLKPAWTYLAADSGQMQMNPIVVDNVLFGISAGLEVFAVDAATGAELWSNRDTINTWHSASRGVAYWQKDDMRRVFFVRGSRLWALNAENGVLDLGFGEQGSIDLRTGLPPIAKDKFITSTTPVTVFKDLLIVPTRVSEGVGAAPGDIRAFNAASGALEWTFHTIPYPVEFGYQTWMNKEAYLNEYIGGANNWAGMAVDTTAGIVFVPTGSTSPDFYGGQRLGDNLFSNCLLALDASTGERIWHFQFVHHDLWDRDPPAPPNLIEVKRQGEIIPAVAQVTKQGYVFIFHRLTGEPLFEIEEKPFPGSDLIGESTAKTQPIPVLPKPFARQVEDLSIEYLNPYSKDLDSLRKQFGQFVKRTYYPPALKPGLLLPGYDGGAEWGGAAADPSDGILYVNSNEMAWELRMESNISERKRSYEEDLYRKHCSSCHQNNRAGNAASGYPSLLEVPEMWTREDLSRVIGNGQGMMPAFSHLKPVEVSAIMDFILQIEKEPTGKESDEPVIPYRHTGYRKWLDSDGLPAINPPWGTLHAIDLNSGQYRWSITLGENQLLAEKGIKETGTENYGGPVVTQNGLLFIAGTKDGFLRCFDKENGALLWQYKLPAPAFMTPAVYQVEGKQFLVVACGGEKLGTTKSNQIIAFALSDE